MSQFSAGQPGRSNEGGVVLVVEDDRGYRQLIRWALEDEGLTVETAADAAEALRVAARQPPALAVLDVGLPGVDGIALASDLRRLCDEQLPIVTITADGRAEQKARLMQARAWLLKPFDLGDLVGLVQRVLESKPSK